MPKNYPLVQLFPAIEDHLDMNYIKSMLLTLDGERTQFRKLRKELDVLQDQLNLWEKVNPFSERDLKGDILKVKVEMEGLAELYNKDILEIDGIVTQAISKVVAFESKFITSKLSHKIKKISASGAISGKKSALETVKELDQHFTSIYKEQYSLCPTDKELTKAYMEYLLVPYHLPTKLKL